MSSLFTRLEERPVAQNIFEDLPTGANIPFSRLDNLAGSFRAPDGAEVCWSRDEGVPCGVRIVVAPVRPGHSLTLEIRAEDGSVTEIAAAPDFAAAAVGKRVFTALLPPSLGTAPEILPILRFAGHPISPRLSEKAPGAAAPAVPAGGAALPRPVWDWSTRFLASLSATVQRQDVGACPDGLRIDWLIGDGRFLGPRIEAVLLPGAADFMRVRPDGMAIVDVRACLQTTDGARIFVAYAGALDLGPDGYQRALRGQFAILPPLVVTPIFETADPRWLWLNRIRCFGVGRVDTQALTYVFDVYAVEVGERCAGGK